MYKLVVNQTFVGQDASLLELVKVITGMVAISAIRCGSVVEIWRLQVKSRNRWVLTDRKVWK